jgi:hypothetical protein
MAEATADRLSTAACMASFKHKNHSMHAISSGARARLTFITVTANSVAALGPWSWPSWIDKIDTGQQKWREFEIFVTLKAKPQGLTRDHIKHEAIWIYWGFLIADVEESNQRHWNLELHPWRAMLKLKLLNGQLGGGRVNMMPDPWGAFSTTETL